MNESAGDAVSQDIRKIKDVLITWIPSVISRELDPPIREGDKKSETRGFFHLDIAHLLVTPVLLAKFDEDPEAYLHSILFSITHTLMFL